MMRRITTMALFLCPSKLQAERWSWNRTPFVEDEAARVLSDLAQ
jgi:hypothetical protein